MYNAAINNNISCRNRQTPVERRMTSIKQENLIQCRIRIDEKARALIKRKIFVLRSGVKTYSEEELFMVKIPTWPRIRLEVEKDPVFKPDQNKIKAIVTRPEDGMWIKFEVDEESGCNIVGDPVKKVEDDGVEVKIGTNNAVLGPCTVTATLLDGHDSEAYKKKKITTKLTFQIEKQGIPKLSTLNKKLIYVYDGSAMVAKVHPQDVKKDVTSRMATSQINTLKKRLEQIKSDEFIRVISNNIQFTHEDFKSLADEYYQSRISSRVRKLGLKPSPEDGKRHISRLINYTIHDFIEKEGIQVSKHDEKPLRMVYDRLHKEWKDNSNFVRRIMKLLYNEAKTVPESRELYTDLVGWFNEEDDYKWSGFVDSAEVAKLMEWYTSKKENSHFKPRFIRTFVAWQRDWDHFVLCIKAINILITKLNKKVK
jgi:hypothetical protein